MTTQPPPYHGDLEHWLSEVAVFHRQHYGLHAGIAADRAAADLDRQFWLAQRRMRDAEAELEDARHVITQWPQS